METSPRSHLPKRRHAGNIASGLSRARRPRPGSSCESGAVEESYVGVGAVRLFILRTEVLLGLLVRGEGGVEESVRGSAWGADLARFSADFFALVGSERARCGTSRPCPWRGRSSRGSGARRPERGAAGQRAREQQGDGRRGELGGDHRRTLSEKVEGGDGAQARLRSSRLGDDLRRTCAGEDVRVRATCDVERRRPANWRFGRG